MPRKEPSIGILLGLDPKKGRGREEPEEDEGYEDTDSDLDPEVDASLSIAFPEMKADQKEALVEAFRTCFEKWEREPHEETEH